MTYNISLAGCNHVDGSWVTGNTTLLAPEFGYKTGLWGMFSYALAGLGLILLLLASRSSS